MTASIHSASEGLPTESEPATTPRGRPIAVVSRGAIVTTLLAGSVLQAASVGAAGVAWGDYDVASFAASGSLVLLPGLLGILGYPLLAVGFTGLFQQAAIRTPVLARIGLWVFLITMAAVTLAAAFSVAVFGIVVDTVPDVPDAVLDATWAQGSTLLAPFILIAQIVGTVASVTLAIIVFVRARIAPLWAIVALGLFGVAKAALPSMPWLDWSALMVLFAVGTAMWVIGRRGAWAIL